MISSALSPVRQNQVSRGRQCDTIRRYVWRQCFLHITDERAVIHRRQLRDGMAGGGCPGGDPADKIFYGRKIRREFSGINYVMSKPASANSDRATSGFPIENGFIAGLMPRAASASAIA